jgi:hypothetical protein
VEGTTSEGTQIGSHTAPKQGIKGASASKGRVLADQLEGALPLCPCRGVDSDHTIQGWWLQEAWCGCRPHRTSEGMQQVHTYPITWL